MPALKKPKWEHFAKLVASGGAVGPAYTLAGYKSLSEKAASGNGCRLMNRDGVRARIDELQAVKEKAYETAITKSVETFQYDTDMAMVEAHEALEMARDKHDVTGFVAAVTLKAKLRQLLVDRKEIGKPGDFGLPRESAETQELAARVKAETAIRKAQEA